MAGSVERGQTEAAEEEFPSRLYYKSRGAGRKTPGSADFRRGADSFGIIAARDELFRAE
jgi:hypothetical protein